MINRKIPWTSQPQFTVGIDQGNLLTKSLVAVISSINGTNLVNNVPVKGLSGAGVVPTPNNGLVADFIGKASTSKVTSNFLLTSPSGTTPGDRTYFIPFLRNGAGGGNFGRLFQKGSNECYLMEDVGTNTFVFVQSTSGGGNLSTQRFSPSGGLSGTVGWHTIAVTITAAGTVLMYLDGVSQGLTGSSYTNGATTQTSAFVLGNRSTDNARVWNGQLGNLYIFDRVLLPDEIQQLNNNPWQIFQSPARRLWVGAAGGGVSLSLTGQSLTANLGALSASITSSVTGNQTTLQQGTITANVSQTLTGQAISLVQGSILSDVSTVITGQTVSLAQGSVTDASSGDVTKALSGQSLSVSQGALTASISLALNGQSIVLSGGSVSPAISSALAGQQSSVQQGTISANISAGLTGQAVVLSNGTVAQAGSDVTKALTGQQLSIALGVLLEKKTIARPSSDTTLGAWLPSAGSSLYATLDEVSPDDADYIYTNSVSTCKIALNAVTDPLTSSGQIVSYRVWSPNSDGLTVRLMQGATEIASWTHTVLPTSPTTYQQALTAGQCDAITDYSTLAIQLESV